MIDFKKESKGGIQGFRYKDLRHFIKEENFVQLENQNTEQIAEILNKKVWR